MKMNLTIMIFFYIKGYRDPQTGLCLAYVIFLTKINLTRTIFLCEMGYKDAQAKTSSIKCIA